MKTIFVDIETGALPGSELQGMIPAFDPAEVKTGNLKDPEKIAEKLREAEEAHRRGFIDRAALDPLTGRVVAIGMLYAGSGEVVIIGHDDEARTLREFWDSCRGEMGRVQQLVGFNVAPFDMPFLIRRSWKHRITVPAGYRRGRYWTEQVVDLRDEWQLGDRQAKGSLDSISRHLGVGAKKGDGKECAAWWQTDRAKAVAYLRNDLELTAKVAAALGLVGF
jgi:hypothetical protein